MVVNGEIPFRHMSCLVLMGFHLAWLRVPSSILCDKLFVYFQMCCCLNHSWLSFKTFRALTKNGISLSEKITWAGKAILKNFKGREWCY